MAGLPVADRILGLLIGVLAWSLNDQATSNAAMYLGARMGFAMSKSAVRSGCMGLNPSKRRRKSRASRSLLQGMFQRAAASATALKWSCTRDRRLPANAPC